MTLEERIKQMLAESTQQTEVTPEVVTEEVVAEEALEEVMETAEEVVAEETKPAKKERTLKEDTQVSSQVAALLEAEGLSEEFKLQAVTIFEAAVTDRVLQIQEELEAEYEEKLDEARAELETNIDGFLNEAVQEWADNNKVAIESNFKTRLAESFMDGLQSLLAEHNIDLPADSEDALEIALDEVNKLEEQVSSVDEIIAEMQNEIDALKAEKILESFKEKMTSTEFDRFVQLTESVKFKDESQYEKQLGIVLENFGKITAKKVEQEEQIVEETIDEAPIIIAPEIDSSSREHGSCQRCVHTVAFSGEGPIARGNWLPPDKGGWGGWFWGLEDLLHGRVVVDQQLGGAGAVVVDVVRVAVGYYVAAGGPAGGVDLDDIASRGID